jgi:hypothetical protein
LAFVSLMALGAGNAAAQSSGITADEEITVVGQRTLRDFRLEVQLARERVFGLFNSLNSDDMFDIHCRNVSRSGTRIPQRVCQPQYSEDLTHDAGNEFAILVKGCVPLTEACLQGGNSRAQAVLSEVPIRGQQLAEEVQRLALENPEFRQAIVGYEAVARRYENARRAEGVGLRISAAIIDPAEAGIPSRLQLQERDVVRPEAVEISAPDASWSASERDDDREGWLKLRFSVLADGTTTDVRVVDAMPPGRDALNVLAAVPSWTFEPATAQGLPIDWHNNSAIVVFNREQTTHAGWPEFAETYEQAAELVSQARYEEAKSQNERLQDTLAVTLEEIAFAQMQLAAIEHALGNPHAALDAIRRATEPAVQQLADEELTLALEHRFSLEIELGLGADALATYRRRTGLERIPARNAMARAGAALEEFLEAPESNLTGVGRIGYTGAWEHSLTWPVFAVGAVDGAIASLDVECNRGKAVPPFDEDVQMTIPSGWGECVLIVNGQTDTTFVVYELKEPID